MRILYRWRPAALLVLTAGLLAGCAPIGHGVYRPSERVVVRTPPPPPPRSTVALYHRADRDALSYTRQINRAIRLSPSQQRQIHERVSARTYHLLDRTHPADHRYLYPFPRQAHERERAVERFWRDVDRDIERVLGPHQRRAYRDYVAYYYPQRAQQHRRHPHGGPPGRRR